MTIRFGAMLQISPAITDQSIRQDFDKIMAAVNDQFAADPIVVNVLQDTDQTNPLDNDSFRLYIQSGSDHRESIPLSQGKMWLVDNFLAVALYIGTKVAELSGKTLNLTRFSQVIAEQEAPSQKGND